MCRKVTKQIVETQQPKLPYRIGLKNLSDYLGPEKYTSFSRAKEHGIGVATGMAWTEYGGDILFTEVLLMKGKENSFLQVNLAL